MTGIRLVETRMPEHHSFPAEFRRARLYSQQQLFKEASKYKKWLGKNSRNPFSCAINGKNDHFAAYYRKSPQNQSGMG